MYNTVVTLVILELPLVVFFSIKYLNRMRKLQAENSQLRETNYYLMHGRFAVQRGGQMKFNLGEGQIKNGHVKTVLSLNGKSWTVTWKRADYSAFLNHDVCIVHTEQVHIDDIQENDVWTESVARRVIKHQQSDSTETTTITHTPLPAKSEHVWHIKSYKWLAADKIKETSVVANIKSLHDIPGLEWERYADE